MRDVIYLLFQLLTTVAKLLQPGGSRTVIAENLILKQQLIIHSRSRQRAPNLSTQDRALLGFWSLFLNPRRITRSAIIIKGTDMLTRPDEPSLTIDSFVFNHCHLYGGFADFIYRDIE